jgi:hypothetical protein
MTVPIRLTQNSELKPLNIWNWTLPAWVVRDTSGKAINVCPQAGACVNVCYARNGTFNFPRVKAAHIRNLELVRNNLNTWMAAMLDELGKKKYRPTGRKVLPRLSRSHLSPAIAALLNAGSACIRIHDSGDFFSKEYLLAWLAIASSTTDVLFYCYTKQVGLFKKVVEPNPPANFLWCYSLGGREDMLVEKSRDRHADVFPDRVLLRRAGYFDQEEHDLLAVVAPTHRIGIVANNIPAYRKKMAGRTFSHMEQDLKRTRPIVE